MLKEIWEFFKKPVYSEDENTNVKYRALFVCKLVLISVGISVILGILINSLETVFGLDLGKHAIDNFFENYPLLLLFGAAVIAAPVLEELLFRGPIIWFRNKSYFPIVFYTLTLVFGFYHITNFEITSTILLLSPILAAPQIVVGSLLGLTRVKLGLVWAIAFHACYNLVLIGPLILLKMLDIPLE